MYYIINKLFIYIYICYNVFAMNENDKKELDSEEINEAKESDEVIEVTLPKRKRLMSKQARNYLLFGILIVSVTALTLYFMLKEDPMAVINTLKNASILPVLAIIGLVLLMVLLEGCILTVITRIYNKKYHVYHGVINGLIGSFFSNVTPFASGGQFVQAYTFTRQGVKASNGASILVMHFIVYQTVLLLYAIVAFAFGYNTISSIGNINLFGVKFTPVLLSIVGFIINSFTIVSLFFLAFCRPLHRFILNTGINLMTKLHLVKNPDAKRAKMMAQVASFRIEFKRLITNYKVLILVFLLLVAKFTCLYSIPYFAGMANGADMNGQYLNSLFSSSYLAMITSFVPIPGGSGGAELGFQALYLNIFGGNKAITSASNILWRGLSYYLVTILGGITFAFYRGKPSGITEKVADTQTFKDLNLTPFIKHKSNYELLEKKYARIDKKAEQKVKLLTKEEIAQSFEKMSSELEQKKPQEFEDSEVDNELINDSKRYLVQVLEETRTIEEENNDKEIEEAVKYDESVLKKAELKKKNKKEKKK